MLLKKFFTQEFGKRWWKIGYLNGRGKVDALSEKECKVVGRAVEGV